jgi:Ser/Thr protein kinase RdoA (MazF antagonist)
MTSDSRSPAPAYAGLEPTTVLDALDALGLRGDGRLLQLNSYENRVYQVHLEDGTVVVAKFYRPRRWSDAQILEEHGFARELAAADIPVVPPQTLVAQDESVQLVGAPPTLAHVRSGEAVHRVAVSARHAGHGPELEDPAVLQWLGRFLGRVHAIGRQSQFAASGRPGSPLRASASLPASTSRKPNAGPGCGAATRPWR